MADHNLSSMSIKDLKELIRKATSEIAKKEKAKVHEARAKVAEIANEYGIAVEHLLKSSGKGRGSRGKAAPKYRNPKDPEQTWAGRGRKPSWLEAELKKGKKLEDFAI